MMRIRELIICPGSLILIVLILTASCSRSDEQLAESDESKRAIGKDVENAIERAALIGLWRGQHVRPESPSADVHNQACWIISREADGSCRSFFLIVDHERKLCISMGPESLGQWRLRDGVLEYRSGENGKWDQQREVDKVNEGHIRLIDPNVTDEFDVEVKIDNVPVVFDVGYRLVAEREFNAVRMEAGGGSAFELPPNSSSKGGERETE